MVKIVADKMFLKLFFDNLGNSTIINRLLRICKLKDLLIIFELCKNILLGNIKIFQKDLNKLRVYEKELIFLSDKKKSFSQKVNLLKKNIFMFKVLIRIGNNYILNEKCYIYEINTGFK